MAARIERGDLWRSNARCLQLRLRDRFRVVVDRRLRRHPIFRDGYFSSSKLRRWIQQFGDFRTATLPPSSVFSRKRVSKNLSEEEESVIQRILQAVAVPIIGNVCHVFMHGLNRIQVFGLEKFHEALLRPKDKSLITVSNHVASVDDPFVIAALLPPRVLMDARNLRWTLCATDRCFRNPITSAFFQSVKVLPVSRGDGIYQKGMDMAISKLNQGGWVHIFPEGSRSRDGGKTLGSSKRGVGRLIVDADTMPMVVPFVHTGMQDIMPIGASLPRIGKTVTVLIGDPINFKDLLNGEAVNGNLYDAISSRIGSRLHELKAQVDQLALQQQIELQKSRKSTVDRATKIMQRINWEPFGIGNFSLDDDETLIQPLELDRSCRHHEISDSHFGVGISHESGITSRMRTFMDKTELMHNFMDKTELMEFAARGLFMNRRAEKLEASPREVRVSPLKIWKQFLEASVLGQLKYC